MGKKKNTYNFLVFIIVFLLIIILLMMLPQILDDHTPDSKVESQTESQMESQIESQTESERDTEQTFEEPVASPYTITNNCENVRMEFVPEKSDEKIITVRIINDSDEEITYGSRFVIEQCIDNEWFELPIEINNLYVTDIADVVRPNQESGSVLSSSTDIAYVVQPHQESDFEMRHDFKYELEAFRKYRIIKEIWDENNEKFYLSVEFEINFIVNESGV